MNPGYKWFKTSGIIFAEKWGNLPGGECFTSPGEVNGAFVVDGVVGDWLCARYGLPAATPPIIEIAGNRIVSCSSVNEQLEEDFRAYTHTDENSDRVGEFAIGANLLNGKSQQIGVGDLFGTKSIMPSRADGKSK
jgi:leucyl aminopeptidase (aminopeptidase T)